MDGIHQTLQRSALDTGGLSTVETEEILKVLFTLLGGVMFVSMILLVVFRTIVKSYKHAIHQEMVDRRRFWEEQVRSTTIVVIACLIGAFILGVIELITIG
ncbi:MAG: hypothetical protein ABIG66_03870 [Candidatus Kerfeldbacteria bacterium]